jgi:hypothetical protein
MEKTLDGKDAMREAEQPVTASGPGPASEARQPDFDAAVWWCGSVLPVRAASDPIRGQGRVVRVGVRDAGECGVRRW